MTLVLPRPLAWQIRAYGEAAYPAECCGVIAGTAAAEKEALALFPMINLRTDDPHRYLIAPEALLQLERELRPRGWDTLGYYHSHPDHPAAPSEFDVGHAWPWYSYVIVRVDGGHAADLASWVLDAEEARMHPEPIREPSEV